MFQVPATRAAAAALVHRVLAAEGITLTDEMFEMMAGFAEGCLNLSAMHDALSIAVDSTREIPALARIVERVLAETLPEHLQPGSSKHT